MEQLEKTRKYAQKLRKNMTKEERHLWYDFLKTYPMQFKRQYSIGTYIVDFYCYQARLVVELDGSQHCDPNALTYDDRRTEFLNRQRSYVLRASNLDVMHEFAGVRELIDGIVRDRVLSCPSSVLPAARNLPLGEGFASKIRH